MASNLLRGFASIITTRVGTLILSVVATPILVRELGRSQYGDYAFLISVLSLSMIFLNSGIFDGTRKYISEFKNETKLKQSIFSLYFYLAVLIMLIPILIYSIAVTFDLITPIFNERYDLYFLLLVVLMGCRQMLGFLRGVLMGEGLEHYSEALRFIHKSLFWIITIGLLLTGGQLTEVLLSDIGTTAFAALLGLGIVWRYSTAVSFSFSYPNKFPKYRLLRFKFQSIILLVLTASLYHIDVILLRLIMGNEVTGTYKAALVISEFAWFIPFALQLVLLHSTSELWSESKLERIRNLASKITRYNFMMIVIQAVGLAVLAREFVPLYFGSGFEGAVIPLLLLLPGVIGFAVARPLIAIGQGKDELWTLIRATGTAALLNLLLNVALIPQFGKAGAAIGTSLSYGSMLLLHVRAARSMGYNPINGIPIGRIAAGGLLVGILIYWLNSAITSAIISLVLIPPIGFVVYIAVMLKLGVIKPEDRERIYQTTNSVLNQR